jgi:hypothetical protein
MLADVRQPQRTRIADEHAEDAAAARGFADRAHSSFVDPRSEEPREPLVEHAERGVPGTGDLERRVEHPAQDRVGVEVGHQCPTCLKQATKGNVVACDQRSYFDAARLELVPRFAAVLAGLLAVRAAGLRAPRDAVLDVVREAAFDVVPDAVFAPPRAEDLAAVERLELRGEVDFEGVTEVRSLSRSLITARFVFATSRRSAVSAVATSLYAERAPLPRSDRIAVSALEASSRALSKRAVARSTSRRVIGPFELEAFEDRVVRRAGVFFAAGMWRSPFLSLTSADWS